jgi:hypothetical protein
MQHSIKHMESSNLLSFREQAAIPHFDVTKDRFKKGHCGFNVDGKCISGGTDVAGSSGYRQAGMGYPTGQAAAEEGGDCAGCHGFPLWYKNNTPYELMGWKIRTNRFPLVGPNQD